MKPLEDRRWFMLVTLFLTSVTMYAMWRGADLHIDTRSAYIFMFSVLGLWFGINKWLAIALIRIKPALGVVG